MRITGSCSFDIVVTRDEPTIVATITATCNGVTTKGRTPMAYTLPVDKLINVKVDYHDIHGNPVDIAPGSMAWDTSDTAIVSVDVDPEDDQQARLIPSGTLGAGQVTATAKNTDGTEVISTLDVTIVAGNAVSGTITPVGEPEPIAPHAEPQHAA